MPLAYNAVGVTIELNSRSQVAQSIQVNSVELANRIGCTGCRPFRARLQQWHDAIRPDGHPDGPAGAPWGAIGPCSVNCLLISVLLVICPAFLTHVCYFFVLLSFLFCCFFIHFSSHWGNFLETFLRICCYFLVPLSFLFASLFYFFGNLFAIVWSFFVTCFALFGHIVVPILYSF